jgi:hypothetical protein
VPEKQHSVKENFKKIKKGFAECPSFGSRQRKSKKKQQDLCRVPCLWHSAKKIEK